MSQVLCYLVNCNIGIVQKLTSILNYNHIEYKEDT